MTPNYKAFLEDCKTIKFKIVKCQFWRAFRIRTDDNLCLCPIYAVAKKRQLEFPIDDTTNTRYRKMALQLGLNVYETNFIVENADHFIHGVKYDANEREFYEACNLIEPST